MLLQKEERTALNTVTAHGVDYIDVNEIRYPHAIFFRPKGEVQAWNVKSAQAITTELIEQAAGITHLAPSALDLLSDAPTPHYENVPEVVIIGTGAQQVLLPASVLAPLLRARIGIEVMSTKAAAGTYNVLMSEGRQVAVALML